MNRLGIRKSHVAVDLMVFLVLISLSTCVTDVDLEFKSFNKNIIVNCLLTPDSSIKVQVTMSRRIDSSERIVNDEFAKVYIAKGEDKNLIAYYKDGYYVSDAKPQEGIRYDLEVEGENGMKYSASTVVPMKPILLMNPQPDKNIVSISIKDQPINDNYYWICKTDYFIPRRKSDFQAYISSDFILFDDFNKIRGEDLTGIMNYSYHFYMRLEDTYFDGQQVSFDIAHRFNELYTNEFKDYKRYIYIICADENLDKYMKSALIQYELGVIGDMPVFHTPIDMYTNIENGKGIFGSCTISQFDITTPESIYQKNVPPNEK
jgi:nitrogen regulatory protein PII